MLNKPKTFIVFYGDYDPTTTLTLRNQFAAQMAKRFRALRGLIRKAIVEQDCFGLNVPEFPDFQFNEMQAPGRRAFNFRTSGEKVQGFMEWLHIQVKEGILEVKEYTQVGKGVEEAWTNMYVQSGYQKGIFKARGELTKAGHPVPSIDETGGLDLAFNQPFHLDRVGLLYARTFNDLKGITDAMEGQISRVLAQGMADGKNPMEIAKLLTKTISGPVGDLGLTDTLGRFMPAERRAKILARTEIIRAHHAATIQEYKNWGVAGVTVQAEWETAGDGRVCPLCAPLQGRTFTLEEIASMIPFHPQCRCCALPVRVDKDGNILGGVTEEDPVAEMFVNSEDAELYKVKKAEYKEFIKNNADMVFGEDWTEYCYKEFNETYTMLNQWQTNTNLTGPMAFRLRSLLVEGGDTKGLIWKRKGVKDAVLKELDKRIPKNQYIGFRAFNQAYMEVKGIKNKELYRGIGGKTGSRIRSIIENQSGMLRTKFTIPDRLISGWSSNMEVADHFAFEKGSLGVSIKKKVPIKDIIIHSDVFSGATRSYMHEAEFILKSGETSFNIKNIKLF